MLLFAVLCQLTFLPIYQTAAVMLLVVLCQLNFSINPAGVNRYSAGTLWVIGLFLQNRQSEVCMLLFTVFCRYRQVPVGGCRFSVGLRRLLRGGLQGSAGTCQYLQMAAGTPRGSALRGSLVTPPGSAGLCGGPPVLTGTYEWPQVLRGAPWVLQGLQRGLWVLHIGRRGSTSTPRGSTGIRGY